jgi:hypothetical protein
MADSSDPISSVKTDKRERSKAAGFADADGRPAAANAPRNCRRTMPPMLMPSILASGGEKKKRGHGPKSAPRSSGKKRRI